MQVGSLVKYRSWYTGPTKSGIVLGTTGEPSPNGIIAKEFVLVMWENVEIEWEEVTDIEVLQ